MSDEELRLKCLELAQKRCLYNSKDKLCLDIDIKNIALTYYSLIKNGIAI